MLILVLNAGSSSLKYQLIDMNTEQPLAVGVVGRISLENSTLTHRVGGEQYVIHQPVSNHTEAVQLVLNTLQDKTMGVIKSILRLQRLTCMACRRSIMMRWACVATASTAPRTAG